MSSSPFAKSVIVRQCSIAEIESATNISELLAEYTDESAIDGMPHPSAKVDMYKSLEMAGLFNAFGAFIDDILVGFITVLSSILPHYATCIPVTESFFVSKCYRNTGAGLKLLHEAERHARERGTGLLISAPIGSALAKILPKKGYIETNRVFFRRLMHA